MALFKSTYFALITNKLAGTVFFRNRYGSIVGRSLGKPVDVNSPALETQRMFFGAAVGDWKSMSQARRDAWTDFAKDTPWVNALGDAINLTGQAMYIGQVCAYRSANPAAPYAGYLDAPCVPGMFPLPLVECACCADPDLGVIVSVTNQDSTNLMHAIVRISRPQSPSKSFFKGPYTGSAAILIANIAAGSSDTAEFCGLCAGRYFVEVRGFDGSNGNNMTSLTYQYFDACTDPP